MECPRCGAYLHFPALDFRNIAAKVSEGHFRKSVSAWVREQNLLGVVAVLDIGLIERAVAVPSPTLLEASRRLLLECGKRTKLYGQNVFLPPLPLAAITWSEDEAALQSLADLLRDEGLLGKGAASEFRLTAKGLSALEVQRAQVDTDQVFVAMSFDPSVSQVYDNGLYAGIVAAGFRPLRIDRHHHLHRIDDEIISQIRRSRFLVADFTGHKHGVYFEAGFALGLGKEVIWSCKKDDLKDLHFDIRQYNSIVWDDENDLSKKLRLRIEAVMGRGPH